MITTSTHTVVGLYRGRSEAERAVQDLVTEGFSRDQISVVAPDSKSAAPDAAPKLGPIESVDTASGMGAAIGGMAGFIGGMVALAIPGIGPVLAMGPLAAGIMGAGIGAAAGGVTGALKGHGVPEEDAARYSAAVGGGSCLVVVHAGDAQIDHAAGVLDRAGALSVGEPDEHIGRSGGTVRTASPEALEAAKLKPGEGVRDRQKASERRANVYPGITGGGPTAAT